MIRSQDTVNNHVFYDVGVVEVGLFLNMVTKVYIGLPNGEVKTLDQKN